MAAMNVFKTTTSAESPLDASRGTEEKSTVSDFLTVQSFANFALMTGAIGAAWHALQKVVPSAATLWVPYAFAFAWAAISVLMSLEGLKKGTGGTGKLELGTVLQALLIGVSGVVSGVGPRISVSDAVARHCWCGGQHTGSESPGVGRSIWRRGAASKRESSCHKQ